MQSSSYEFTRRQALSGLGGVSVLALGGCATMPRETGSNPQALLDRIAWNLLEVKPERATGQGVDVGDRAWLRSRVEDHSAAGQRHITDVLRRDLARANAVDIAGLDPSTRTSFEVVRSAYATALEGFALSYGDIAVGDYRNAPYTVIQNVGAYLDVPQFLGADQPLENASDAEAWLSRLSQLPEMLDGETDRIRAARAKGVIPPDFLLDKTLAGMASTLADARSGTLFVADLTRRLGEKGVADRYSGRARALVQGPVQKALLRQQAELLVERGLAKSAPGMWAQPHGEQWYDWALRASTTTRLTPDEIHRIGNEQLAEIQGRMDTILKSIGYANGPVGARMNALAEDARYKFADGDPGRAEIMAFAKQRLAWIKAQTPRAFQHPVDPNFEIRRLPLAQEPGAAGAYGGAGSKDGKIPGKIWLNLRTTDLQRTYTLPTLMHHEGIPGHVWQGEYSNTLPLIRSILAFNAFSEGWALYAEQLADELGAYAEHPEWRLGYLQDQAFRACRLIADTGLHAKQWTRAQAVQLFVEKNGDNATEVASEVDRYCSWPGQACGYKIGHTEILRQRTRAQAALGAAYDLKAFDQAVVEGGNVPLDVLAKNVDHYIAEAKG